MGLADTISSNPCAATSTTSRNLRPLRAPVQYLTAAARHFRQALREQPGNIYAANGLGAVCASMGQLGEAHAIFGDLRESAAALSGSVQLPDVRPCGC